ncbi:MAG: RNA polymerase sigma factor, partial [Planctomycetes bacterium]|nr:RNA polymerase sigma factor [Planctomycetota bacterium]
VAAAIDELEEGDRSLVILRGIEGQPYKDISLLLRKDENALKVQYHRALEKLRKRLPGGIFDEVEGE